MTEKEMLKMALEALEDACGNRCNAEYNPCFQRETITAIKEALAQPEQEPWECVCGANLYIDANGVPRSKASVEPATVMFKPDQEPVAWMYEFYADMGHKGLAFEEQRSAYNTPLYTTPPQRKPLTDEEIDELSRSMVKGDKSVNWLCRAIEAKLKEKNNG